MRVGVIGVGYVGLTSAACLARLGHHVVAADLDEARISVLNNGEVPMVEDGMSEIVEEGLAGGRLRFEVGAAAAARRAEIVMLAVQTPQGSDGSADLTVLDAAVTEVAAHAPDAAVIVNKSTAPVGTVRRIERIVAEVRDAGVLPVVSNPEFLREGSAVNDFLRPDRMVIGADDAEAAHRVAEMYAGVQAPIIVTDPESAEMIKYASNAFLATKVGFINSIANLCEATGADVREVALGMGHDPRIGFEFLRPGPGYGGSCFPKDTAALSEMAARVGVELRIVDAVRAANLNQHDRVVDKIRRLAPASSLDGARIGVLGLTFKAGTDDLRDSPAIAITRGLLGEGAAVRAYDPMVTKRLSESVSGVEICSDPYDACDGVDVVTVLTEWDEFRWLDFERLRARMAGAAVVDARNLWDPSALRRHGFAYEGIGR